MKKLFLGIIGVILLSACSNNGINEDNAEKSAKYINQKLSIANEVEERQEEYFNEIMNVYKIGEFTTVIPNKESGIEQINFSNVDKVDISKILELFEFPESESIDSLIENYYYDIASTGSYEANEEFVIYEDLGISTSVKSEVLLDVLGEKPFMLTVLYNEERFDEFK
ncbi:hypothetical protein LHA31_10145 [Carnobacterium viridans]|uniref:Lipoprotein n=1 Tax=Carnobacterium viridans TaxID=174587 RepID=A0A1H0YXL4_9LACT|nr:hypothetical protein [Carnobacterium viridans]UDE94906.1 hypothetical protein LHA31_10145 [Carnobacterium viridans]SDQ19661.1 hypothetical protein SAMN04487752_1199 [Carnobacterium viridans]